MTADKPTPSMQERMAELKDTLEKEKVKLTSEVETYIQDHVRAVQAKLQNGEEVYEEDLAFIDEVKLWVGATKRYLSPKQWLDVLHVAKAAGKSREWIDKTFTFPGGGKIEFGGDLNLNGSLTRLPEGLEVSRNLFVSNCPELASLPDGLRVGGGLSFRNCSALAVLAKGIKVQLNLSLVDCPLLTSLPDDLKVGWLFLSGNLDEQVKTDAKRLQQKGIVTVFNE